MNRFEVMTESREGHKVYVLRDLQSGTVARIVPSLGGNCLELKMAPRPGVATIAVIDDMKHIDKVAEQPSRYGIPVLFPWPSGIAEGVFEFRGKRYDLNGPDVKRSSHHGFVNRVAWRVLRSDCDNTGAWLTCIVESKDCGEDAARYPSTFALEMTWKLTPERLLMHMEARNTGNHAMPVGLGLHPYFTVPFGPKGSRAECRLAATVQRQWDLDVTVAHKPGMPAPERMFRADMEFDPTAPSGRALDDVNFNHVYDASFDVAKETRATIVDPANDVELSVRATGDFTTWVIYNPKDRQVLSLEPWTLTPNGFNLAAAGVEKSGMIVLEPGERWQGEVAIHVD